MNSSYILDVALTSNCCGKAESENQQVGGA